MLAAWCSPRCVVRYSVEQYTVCRVLLCVPWRAVHGVKQVLLCVPWRAVHGVKQVLLCVPWRAVHMPALLL